MIRFLFPLFLILPVLAQGQSQTVSLGLTTGITSGYTLDEGIDNDPRYSNRYLVRFAPIGFNYSVDYEGYGFYINPGLINVGQTFNVVNTVGGHVGERESRLQYIQVPIAFKLHLFDMSFFKWSVVAGISPAYLLSGKETVDHSKSKLRFPSEVYPILPSDYEVVYDGVVVPTGDYTMLSKKDFKSYQFFAFAGFRADWDVSDHWRILFDFRAHYGLVDPRTNTYVTRLKNHETLYDLEGTRRDVFAQFSVGFARFLEIDDHEQDKRKKVKGSPKRSSSGRNPWPGPRSRKPKG